jgi:hypothetical protein
MATVSLQVVTNRLRHNMAHQAANLYQTHPPDLSELTTASRGIRTCRTDFSRAGHLCR